MATEEKILKDEVLSDDELEQVAGGTDAEYKELTNILPKISYWYNPFLGKARWMERAMEPEEMKDYLKKTYNIDSHINIYTGFRRGGGAPNEYSRNGVSMSHAEVVEFIKTFKSNN